MEKAHVAPQDTATRRPDVGGEVRRWRLTRQLTLAQVGDLSGLNVGYLSQIENGKAVPSLDALVAIAAALEVPIAWLFLDSAPAPRVVRATERPRETMPEGGAMEEVDGGTARDVRILEAVVPPGSSTGVHAHTGDEHHVILTGRWRMSQGDETFEVGPGDYVAWDPTIPHDVECLGPEVGRMLVIYPRHRRGPDARPAAQP
ncbi:MAG TPA: helix-turn-helix domain-containing protein [Candidatus Limnocylindrales bacterium]|nr:helix-turn-helix domain-containing protein [Candidatus Limnocylindrales bacterium]